MLDAGAIAWEVSRWAWALPIAILLWWLTRRLHCETPQSGEPEWMRRPLWFHLERLDRVSLAIIASIGMLFWIGRNSVFPVPPDSLYHLIVARRIAETGTIPLWNDWQYYPLGRPHLYPPLFHLLLAGMAKLCSGDFFAAFRLTESVALPFVFFSTWYLARWLFDARYAFVALLLVGMDYSLAFTAAMGTPSVLATSFLSLALVCFLSGRWLLTTVLMIVIMYTHLGVPPIALGALGVFSLLHRRYLPNFLAVATISLLAASPWYARLFVYRDWFAHPLEIGAYGAIPLEWLPLYKFTWLQMVSVTMLILILRSLRGLHWREYRVQLLIAVIVASLPMLFGYGGRFYTHTLHLWAILAAGIFVQHLVAPVTAKRLAAFGLLALTPTAVIIGTGTPLNAGIYPAPSAWILPPVVASGALTLINKAQPPGYISWEDAQAVADRVNELTEPGQPIYFEWDRDFGLMIQWLTNRPMDVGAWEETRPKHESLVLIEDMARRDPHACYVSRYSIGFPDDCTVEKVGNLYIGIRTDEHKSTLVPDESDGRDKKQQRKAHKAKKKSKP